jgi:hypothetical protein
MSDLDSIQIGDWLVIVSTMKGSSFILPQVTSTTNGLVRTLNYTFRRDGRSFSVKQRGLTARLARSHEIEQDKIGFIDGNRQAVFGRGYAAEPDALIEELRKDEAITAADTLLLTVPNQLGVAYNAHVLEAIPTTVAPALGWR